MYAGAFEGDLGTFEGKVHLELDDSLTPVKVRLRRIPAAVEEILAKELCGLEQLGIIEKMDQLTNLLGISSSCRRETQWRHPSMHRPSDPKQSPKEM